LNDNNSTPPNFPGRTYVPTVKNFAAPIYRILLRPQFTELLKLKPVMAPTLLQKVLFVLAFARASFALVDTCDCTWTCPPGFTSSYQWRYPLCNGNTIPDFLAESILFSPTPAGEQFIISTCAHGSNCVGALYGLSATGSIQSCTLSGMGAYPNCVDGNAGLGGATVFFLELALRWYLMEGDALVVSVPCACRLPLPTDSLQLPRFKMLVPYLGNLIPYVLAIV